MTHALVCRLFPFAALAAVSGCAMSGTAPPVADMGAFAQTEANGIAESAADRVAAALVAAEAADRAADRGELELAMLALDRLGAAPQTDADHARLDQWRGQLGTALPPMRGRALGPAYRSGSLRPGGKTSIEQTFLGGKRANIVVRVSAGAQLQLRVSDVASRQVCDKDSRVIQCRWMPLYTQRHRIELANLGDETSTYYIVFD